MTDEMKDDKEQWVRKTIGASKDADITRLAVQTEIAWQLKRIADRLDRGLPR